MKIQTIILFISSLILVSCSTIEVGAEKGIWINRVTKESDYMEFWFDGNGNAIAMYSGDNAFPHSKKYLIRNDSIIFMDLEEFSDGNVGILPPPVKLLKLTEKELKISYGDSTWVYVKISENAPKDLNFYVINRDSVQQIGLQRLDSLYDVFRK